MLLCVFGRCLCWLQFGVRDDVLVCIRYVWYYIAATDKVTFVIEHYAGSWSSNKALGTCEVSMEDLISKPDSDWTLDVKGAPKGAKSTLTINCKIPGECHLVECYHLE